MNNIRRIRTRLKLSQIEFAVVTGVTQATVSRWESGHLSPNLDEMERLRQWAREKGKSVKPDEFFAKPAPAKQEAERAA